MVLVVVPATTPAVLLLCVSEVDNRAPKFSIDEPLYPRKAFILWVQLSLYARGWWKKERRLEVDDAEGRNGGKLAK
jgi:hypothetical protein